MTNVTNLTLPPNVSGVIDSLIVFASLTTFNIGACSNITGTPAQIAAKMPAMRYLTLTGSGITGDISGFASLVDLINCYTISLTGLFGSIPVAFNNAASLRVLHMLGCVNTYGTIAGFTSTDLDYISLQSTGANGGLAVVADSPNFQTVSFASSAILAPELNIGIDALYTKRATLIRASVGIYTNGTKPYSGTYTAPPANDVSDDNWQWDGVKHVPLTGFAKLYVLVNDLYSEGNSLVVGTYTGYLPPTVNAIADQTDPESVQVSAVNPGDNVLTYSATNLPVGFSINPTTGLISGVSESIDVNAVTATVADAFGGSDDELFNWTVTFIPVTGPQIIVTDGSIPLATLNMAAPKAIVVELTNDNSILVAFGDTTQRVPIFDPESLFG
jgi:hypothetical protein